VPIVPCRLREASLLLEENCREACSVEVAGGERAGEASGVDDVVGAGVVDVVAVGQADRDGVAGEVAAGCREDGGIATSKSAIWIDIRGADDEVREAVAIDVPGCGNRKATGSCDATPCCRMRDVRRP
jgi:hypothetical protein